MPWPTVPPSHLSLVVIGHRLHTGTTRPESEHGGDGPSVCYAWPVRQDDVPSWYCSSSVIASGRMGLEAAEVEGEEQR